MTGGLPPRWRSAPAFASAALLALLLRLVHLAELSGTPLLAGPMGDGRQYDAWAQRIAGGDWIGTEVFYQTPLYPYALAVLFRAGGHDLDLVRLVQALLGAASCVMLGLAGRRFFSDRVGVLAALLLAIYPPAIFFDGLIQKSSLDIFLATLLLALLGEFTARRRWPWLAAAGIVTAAFVLNRENARVLYPVIGAWLCFGVRDVPVRRRVGWTAIFAVASLLALLPVGFRNHRVGGEFLISTSQLGPNFYIGNNPRASGTYEPLLPGRGDAVFEREDAARLASQASGRALAPGEVSDYWLRRSFEYVRSEPLHWLALLGKKILLTLNAAELPDTESIEAYGDYSRVLRALAWLNFGVVLPLAAFGAWLHRAEWRRLLVLYLMFGGLALAVAIFYVVARYRHPLVPIVLLFTAAGVTGLWNMRPRRARAPEAAASERKARRRSGPGRRPSLPESRKRWLTGAVVAALVAIVANLPIAVARDETYLNLGVLLAQNGRPADAVAVLLKAVAVDPGNAEAQFRLGLAWQDAGQPQAAIEALETAVRLRPGHADAHVALGILLRGEGRSADALPHFREAVRYAPDSVEARTNLGLALMEAGQPEAAAAEHRRAVALAPDSPRAHNNLAMALQQSGDVRQAVAEYEKALAIDAHYAEGHANLALALLSSREFEPALLHFREAVRLRPDSHELRAAFGAALCEAGRLQDGLEQYEAALGLANAAGRPDAARDIRTAIQQLRERMAGRSR